MKSKTRSKARKVQSSRTIADVTATFAVLRPDGWPEATIRICRDRERPRSFYPLAFRDTLCRVKPSVAGGVADEDIALFHQLRAIGTFGSEQRALSAARAALTRRRKQELVKLVGSAEFGPYECPGDAPWYFIADIFERIAGSAKFFPIVRRREIYRMTAPPSKTPTETVVEVIDTAFEPAQFVRASARTALTAIASHIVGTFAPADLQKRPMKLLRTVEIARGAGAFVAKIYDDPQRGPRVYSVFRRTAYRLNAGISNKQTSGVIETLVPGLANVRTRASAAATLKAAIAAIDRLPA